MPLYSRGTAPVGLFVGDEPVLRIHLGEELLWDGTRSATGSLTAATAQASGRNILAAAGSSGLILPGTAQATAGMLTGSASAGGAITPAAATADGATIGGSASASGGLTAASATAQVLDMTGEETWVVDAYGVISPATADAAAGDIAGSASASGVLTPAAVSGLVRDIHGEGAWQGTVTPATATASAADVAGSTSAAGTVSTATAASTGQPIAGAASASGTISAATATATGQNITGTAVDFTPSGMTKNGTFGLGSSYVQMTGWLANTTSYPGSTVSSNDLVVQSSGAGKTIEASIIWTSTSSSFTRSVTMRLKLNGTVIATGATATVPGGIGNTVTATVTATGVTVVAGDLIRLEATGVNTTNQPNANTSTSSYVRIV